MQDKILVVYAQEGIFTEDSDPARELYNKNRFGSLKDNKVHLSFIEAAYLHEKERVRIVDKRNKEISKDNFLKKSRKHVPDFHVRYSVFKDIRDRGYIIKTALKFGADFRIYDRGVKPGEDHARWIVYPVLESQKLTWYEFAAKNRVAHSTKKRLLIGVVDDEGDVSYWECRWLRP